MKNALALAALACNPNSPSPTASMVRVRDGFLEAFGGLFSIRVPVKQDLAVAFNPSAVKTFFRKPRKVVSYTVKGNKLTLKEGKESLSVRCLPADDMVFLDVLGKVKPCSLDTGLLKYLSDIIDPANFRAAAHGVTSRDGMLLATNNRVFGAAYLDDELPDFNIHTDACKALAKFKAKVTGVVSDGRATKFVFDDSSSFCVLNLSEELPDVTPLFKEEWEPLGLTDSTLEDLQSIHADYFVFRDGNVQYRTEDKSAVGEIACGLHKEFAACSMKATLGFVLRNGGDISFAKNMSKLRSVNQDVCVITSLMRNESEVTP